MLFSVIGLGVLSAMLIYIGWTSDCNIPGVGWIMSALGVCVLVSGVALLYQEHHMRRPRVFKRLEWNHTTIPSVL